MSLILDAAAWPGRAVPSASSSRATIERFLNHARRTQTYAIRLAVEGGGQVKAELVSVGQSGEQSLKRIESAGSKASSGLVGLGRQAELLRTGIRTLGGALTAPRRSVVSAR